MTSLRTIGMRGERLEKLTVIHGTGTPGFLGVVGACVCNRYQALILLSIKGPGYEGTRLQLSHPSP